MNGNLHNPYNYKRRSFVYRKLTSLKAEWREINECAALWSINNAETEIKHTKHLALCDLNALNRIGLKGADTFNWFESHNISIIPEINHAYYDSRGFLIARLGYQELFLLDLLLNDNEITSLVEKKWREQYIQSSNSCGFILPRQDSHACFAVCGKYASDMFSKLCSVDLRTQNFENLSVIQTILACVSTIIIRNDLSNISFYFIFAESSVAEYLWDCIIDAMDEFNGKLIGLSTVQSLVAQ